MLHTQCYIVFNTNLGLQDVCLRNMFCFTVYFLKMSAGIGFSLNVKGRQQTRAQNLSVEFMMRRLRKKIID